MGTKRRRLKRYLGIKRDGNGGHQGGVEHLLPGRITGWVFGASEPFHEVRLLVGAHLIARADVDRSRPDVCEVLGREGTPGFSMTLPAELPPLDWRKPTRVVALSADGSQQTELQLIGKESDTSAQLRRLLQSEVLGLDGHFDGLVASQLRGWARRNGQSKPAQIWMQAMEREPIPIDCCETRDGMAESCGFDLSLSSLPETWSGCELWCSFDQEGVYRLPQDQIVIARERRTEAQTTLNSGEIFVAGTKSAREDLRLKAKWDSLEGLSHHLDLLEQKLEDWNTSERKQDRWRLMTRAIALATSPRRQC